MYTRERRERRGLKEIELRDIRIAAPILRDLGSAAASSQRPKAKTWIGFDVLA